MGTLALLAHGLDASHERSLLPCEVTSMKQTTSARGYGSEHQQERRDINGKAWAANSTIPAAVSPLTCAACGRRMAQGPRSRPQGSAVCHPCRRARREAETLQALEASRRNATRRAQARAEAAQPARSCSHCRAEFTPKNARQRLCSRECWYALARINPERPRRRAQPKRSTTERGYGAAHQKERERWRPLVEAGKTTCCRCGRAISPGARWDLDHEDHDRTRYKGPAHRSCNRAAGARKGNRSRARKPSPRRVQTTRLQW